VQYFCHLDVHFDWDDAHNEDLYFLHEVFFFMAMLFVIFLSSFEGNAL